MVRSRSGTLALDGAAGPTRSVANCSVFRRLIVVREYADAATGTMIETADGGGRFHECVLRPRVAVDPGTDVAIAARLHERAHALCFIASSVNFPVRVEPDVGRAT